METAASPLYKPLNPNTSEIRLLEVPSGDSEDWGLVTVSLDDNPEYYALSYVWGEKKDLKKIVLQGQDMEVTPNLAAALSRIRSGSLGETPTPVKYLWVDAICINQEDNEERSQQVRFMHLIFKCAQVVFSWVGPKDYSLAFQTIKTLAQVIALNWRKITTPDDSDVLERMFFSDLPPFEFEWLRLHPSLCNETPGTEGRFKNNEWKAVRELLADQYWTRLWIFQEVVFARQLHLFSSGGITLNQQDLFMFTQSFHSHPKDYIYGLLAVSQIPIIPDYNKSVAQLYTEFVKHWMEDAKEVREGVFTPLGFLSLAGVGHFGPSDNFPSWAPNFPKNALSKRPNLLKGRNLRRKDPSNYPYVAENTGSLFVWGAEIEPILHVSSFSAEGSLRDRIFAIGNALRRYTSRHQHGPQGRTSWETIAHFLFDWRTLLSKAQVNQILALAAATSKWGKMDHPNDLGGWDSPDCLLFPNGWETRLYQLAFPNKDLTDLNLSGNPLKDKELEGNEKLGEYLELIIKAMEERSLFETERGYLGRGPRNAHEGDVLCVLKNYHDPVLLRKQGNYYTFVSRVYVVHMSLYKSARNSPSGLKWLELR